MSQWNALTKNKKIEFIEYGRSSFLIRQIYFTLNEISEFSSIHTGYLFRMNLN